MELIAIVALAGLAAFQLYQQYAAGKRQEYLQERMNSLLKPPETVEVKVPVEVEVENTTALEAVKKELVAAAAANAHLQDEYEARLEAAEGRNAAIAGHRAELEALLDEASKENARLKDLVTGTGQKIGKELDQALADRDRMIASYQAAVEMIEDMRDGSPIPDSAERAILEADKKALESELDMVREELRVAKSLSSGDTQELIRQLDNLRDSKGRVDERLSDSMQTIKSLNAKLGLRDLKVSELEALVKERAEMNQALRNELANTRASMGKETAYKSGLRSTIQKLTEERDEAKRTVAALKEQALLNPDLKQANKYIQELTREINEIAAQNMDIKRSQATMISENSALKKEIEMAKQVIDEDTYTRRMEQLDSRIRSAKRMAASRAKAKARPTR